MPYADPVRGHQWAAAYREANRENERAKQKAWREANRERRRAWAKEHRQKPHVRERRRDDKIAARALRHEAFVEPVSRSVVWQRDGGVCGICHEPADPERWDLDHVIPLSRGGKHEYANVQVSHPLCNQRKGSKCA